MIATLFLGVCLAASAQAVVHRCRGDLTVRMTGDLFSPVECATAPVSALPLTVEAAIPAVTDLAAFAGAWEGTLLQGFNRYEVRATLRLGRGGKADADLDLREMQLGARVAHRIFLAPVGRRGRYAVTAASDRLKGESLKGTAVFGVSPSGATASGTPQRQLDVLFANGAEHRVLVTFDGKDRLSLKFWSAIPGWPVRTFEMPLRRSARQR